MSETFLDGRVVLHCGDSMEILKSQPDCSIDSFVTDPPYALVSIVKRFGAAGSAPVVVPAGGSGAYARASSGFMGQKWDNGDTAHNPAFWAEVYRVLKPGGFVLASSGTRTYHWLACAIEDGGFEIRDMIAWLYGSGFPKSHNVSKVLDKRNFGSGDVMVFKSALAAAVKSSGKTRKQINEECGFTMRFDIGFEKDPAGWGCSLPTPEQYDVICKVLDCDGDASALLSLREWSRTKLQKLYKVVGYEMRQNSPSGIVSAGRKTTLVERELTEPYTDAAREWEGWGTALKPAIEPIVMARKPLIGTVAENVLRHGAGAINIDGCRVEREPTGERRNNISLGSSSGSIYGTAGAFISEGSPLGRWPANVVHDGSGDVVEAFPAEAGAFAPVRGTEPSNAVTNVYGARERTATLHHGDSGSAARFFYTAKADADDRLGSKHPTVKPVSLMQWLVRLVTPKGGLVLDPFAGTGSTAEACFREGMRCILIEREMPYQVDIRRRMALCMAGPDERARESIKAKTKGQPVDAGPLFEVPMSSTAQK